MCWRIVTDADFVCFASPTSLRLVALLIHHLKVLETMARLRTEKLKKNAEHTMAKRQSRKAT